MQPLRWAIIGVGRFGKLHARALTGLPGCEVVAICNRNRQRLAEASQELGIDQT